MCAFLFEGTFFFEILHICCMTKRRKEEIKVYSVLIAIIAVVAFVVFLLCTKTSAVTTDLTFDSPFNDEVKTLVQENLKNEVEATYSVNIKTALKGAFGKQEKNSFLKISLKQNEDFIDYKIESSNNINDLKIADSVNYFHDIKSDNSYIAENNEAFKQEEVKAFDLISVINEIVNNSEFLKRKEGEDIFFTTQISFETLSKLFPEYLNKLFDNKLNKSIDVSFVFDVNNKFKEIDILYNQEGSVGDVKENYFYATITFDSFENVEIEEIENIETTSDVSEVKDYTISSYSMNDIRAFLKGFSYSLSDEDLYNYIVKKHGSSFKSDAELEQFLISLNVDNSQAEIEEFSFDDGIEINIGNKIFEFPVEFGVIEEHFSESTKLSEDTQEKIDTIILFTEQNNFFYAVVPNYFTDDIRRIVSLQFSRAFLDEEFSINGVKFGDKHEKVFEILGTPDSSVSESDNNNNFYATYRNNELNFSVEIKFINGYASSFVITNTSAF